MPLQITQELWEKAKQQRLITQDIINRRFIRGTAEWLETESAGVEPRVDIRGHLDLNFDSWIADEQHRGKNIAVRLEDGVAQLHIVGPWRLLVLKALQRLGVDTHFA